MEGLLTVLGDMADSLRVLAAREADGESKQSKAIRLLVKHGPDNLAAIARMVGVSRATLYNWTAFQSAVEKLKASRDWTAREFTAIPEDEL